MRPVLSLLVLLFSMCGAQTRRTQTEVQTESQSTGSAAAAAAAAAEVSTTQVDIYVELKELRDMVMDLRAIVRHNQDDIKVLEAVNVAVKERLAASETEVGNLKKETAAQEAELASVKCKLAATEEENAAQQAELTEVKTRLATAETEVGNLEKEIKAAPKVAFSASLGNSGYITSGTKDLNVVFSEVITNVGQAYNSVSGFFTAPVSGVYYFRFTVSDILPTQYMHIQMHKNGQGLMYLAEYNNDSQRSYLSSGLTLQLEKGDAVNLVLPAGNRLHDSKGSNHNTFSGFLLYPL
ncbi:uncharacterized protein LOC134451913 [Engraulis encrasicolus]|uniref:uncharacterized protein LOC134451913 n=1 Tax=Engraulis encrasicolus TaxID=184585 RepID=UPI002FD1D98E